MIHTDLGLEINATRSCTNACNNCNHASTKFTASYYMSPEVLLRDVNVLKDKIRVKLFMVQGGEPLLHPKICDLLRIIHDSGIGNQCGVLTNGKLLPRMKQEFWDILGERKMELRISCYPDLDPEIVPFANIHAAKLGFTVRAQQITEFKQLFKKNDGSTYYGCPWNRCLTIHEGFFYLCPLTTFFPKQFMGLPETIDGIPLDGIKEEDIQFFLNRSHPLEACKICAGARGEGVPWSNAKTEKEWMDASGINL